MNPNKALWEKGDFTVIAATMREAAATFVATLGVAAGMKVLDVGCGDGTTAVPLAELGAEVMGIDIASNLVAAGRRRATELGLTKLEFQEGNACCLDGVADDSFDLSLSMFGAMFAPKPFEVAKELVRVTKPGGRVVMGNWIPNDPTFVAQVLKICSTFMPAPPEGFVSPMTWGVEKHIVERFERAGVTKDRISMEKKTLLFRAPDQSPGEVIEMFRQFYGPTMNAFDAAERNERSDELKRQLAALAETQNTKAGGGTEIPATFLQVTVEV